MEPIFVARGVLHYAAFGDAHCAIGSAAGMNQVTAEYLARNPKLFSAAQPVEPV